MALRPPPIFAAAVTAAFILLTRPILLPRNPSKEPA